MDTQHDSGFFGRLEVYGVAQPVIFEGSVQRIVMQAVMHMKGVNLRKNQAGAKTFKLEFSSEPFNADDEEARFAAVNNLTIEEYRRVKMDSDGFITQEQLDSIQTAPWRSDPNWKRFHSLMASRSNYELALPGEVRQLQDSLRDRWKGVSWLDADGNREDFTEELIRDRRA